jgi:Putative zinc-finger
MQHLDEGTIHAWLDGALAAEQAADVERHARDCAECAALVADARGMIAGAARIVSALDDVPAGVIPKQQPATASRSLWRTLHLTPLRAALAASLMVAAASLAVIRHAPLERAPLVDGPFDARSPVPTAAVPAAAQAPAATPTPAVATPAATSLNKDREKAEEPPRRELAKQPAPAAAPRGAEERQEKVAEALDSTKAKTAVDSARSLVAGGVAKAVDASAVDRTRATSQVVEAARRSATAATGAPPPSAPTANVIASRAMSQPSVQLKVADIGAARPLTLTSDDGRPLALPGCYQIVRDSLSVAARLLDRLPDRFSLDTEPGALRNIVRGLTQDGRRDSVIAGITWRPAPGGDRFVLISGVAPQQGAMFAQTPAARSKQDAASSGARVAAGSGTFASARLSRVDCR